MIPHRSTALLSVIVFVALLLFIFSSSPIPVPVSEKVSGAAEYVRPKLEALRLSDFHLPSFRPPAHEPPPEQKNSTRGDSKWFSDFRWLNPFSSSVTLDEGRSVLPPLADRRAVYTYFDRNYNPRQHSGQDRAEEKKADYELLLAWRRAWYAQGFKPVILGPGDAQRNPYYETVHKIKLSTEAQNEVYRWLAWGHMGSGLLADFHCFPMARYDDPLLSSLRRGSEPEHITRFENFNGGLYAAEKHMIDRAIAKAAEKLDDKSTSMTDLMPAEFFRIEQPSSLAFYRSSTITSKYSALGEKISKDPAAGRKELVKLINAHLHNTFQNGFPAGLAVLKPFPTCTTALVEPALRLAKALVQCPDTPMADSCPPNLPDCRPCGSGKQTMRISQPATYKNTTFLFTIGTLPHPYTLISLQKNSEEITTRHIRRATDRDPWLFEVTRDQLGDELGGSSRGIVFKQVVAGPQAIGSSLWMTVESLPGEAGTGLPPDLLDEFEWQLGFQIPRGDKADPKIEGGKGNQDKPQYADKESFQFANPSEQGIPREYELIQKAREVIKSEEHSRISIKDVAEAWNLADSEVWRFVKAYRARLVVERRRWQEEEQPFAKTT
ncbi:hypothetical protein N7474_006895 [Penicillium riverlandense]|uniref:uncharacterized protein n=1 Tax=Penicillium riverlandense TaxID=1903569 RepID=UPI0025478D0B|nr:uncharacterized protein N7474_006895 [Penicillium riverlandense]KAJ5815118.1 hypothetical protein N7474_006895 [Penicillium riverlandense]